MNQNQQNPFFKFEVSQSGLAITKQLHRKRLRNFFVAFTLIGCGIKSMFYALGVVDNSVKKSALRRLDFKRLEDIFIDVKNLKEEINKLKSS